LCADLACAIAQLEQLGIVHGDVSAANILIGQTGAGKPICILCDYDDYSHVLVQRLPRNITPSLRRLLGTSGYRYPDLAIAMNSALLNGSDVSVITDRYALGVAICEMMVWSDAVEHILQRQNLVSDRMAVDRDLSSLPQQIIEDFPQGFDLLHRAVRASSATSMPSPQDWLSVLGYEQQIEELQIQPSVVATAKSSRRAKSGDLSKKPSLRPVDRNRNRSQIEEQDSVEFAISYPAKIGNDSPFLVDAWMFRHEDLEIAIRRATSSGESIRGGGAWQLPRGSQVTVKVEIHSWLVEPNEQTIIWSGDVTGASFRVVPNGDQPSDKMIGACTFFWSGLRIAQLFFQIAAQQKADQQKHVLLAKPIETAFASYASQDRRRVLSRVAGIEKLGVKVLMDVRNLAPNDDVETAVFDKIDAADVLYLFWSRHAKKSLWVDKEWRYGLERKGLDFIDPVPLVGPRIVPPPVELAHKHFHDWTLVCLGYENSINFWSRFRCWLAGEY